MDLARLLAGAGFQTHDAWEWVFAVAPLLALAEVLFLVRSRRIPLTWDQALVSLARGSLAVAFLGFVWDVDWHADLGRDSLLFTVPHVLILMGLGGIGLAALAGILVPKERIGIRVGRLDVPYSALALGALATGALIGFPLDDLWHRTYGIDVTMWSPTHLLMIGGASLAPIVMWLAMREGSGRAPAGFWRYATGGIALVGLSTFQLEYDVGVEQWQLLLQPMLIATATAIALTAARAAGGRGAALTSVLAFWLIRGVIDLLLGPGLQRDIPRIPLYFGEALAIEACFLVLPRLGPVALGLVAGGAAAVAGIATEWPWTHLCYALPWQPSLLPHLWLAVAVGLAGGVVGMAVGGVIARRPGPRAGAVAAALVAIAALFALHVPFRHAEPATVTVRTTSSSGGVAVNLSVRPPSAAAGADLFEVVSWQGGSVRNFPLRQTGPGEFATSGPVPVLGRWKSLLLLGRGDVLEAAPVAMPADPAYGLPAIPPPAERQETFVPASRLLMREAHGGTPVPAIVASVAFLFFAVLWPLLIALAFRFVAEGRRLEVHLPFAARRRLNLSG